MQNNQWTFTDNQGSFSMENPESINELYFPLCNDLGLMSSITPVLHGDLKQNQHNFMLLPTSLEDLHNSKAARNFWLNVADYGPWSVSGNSALAHANRFNTDNKTSRKVDAGLLWHKVTYTDAKIGLESKVLNFIPVDQKVEIMQISITNISDKPLSFSPISAIPIYGRSADNIRDHRHVTSLVNRTTVTTDGLEMQPVILFDETGHKYNHVRYFVYGCDANGESPIGVCPTIESFIGSKGDLEWPESVVLNNLKSVPAGTTIEGKESIAALGFKEVTLAPLASIDYIIILGIGTDSDDTKSIFSLYNSTDKVKKALDLNKAHWQEQATKVSVESGLEGFSNWLKWIEVQPVFRKIFGCSFLPSHDYGKGGRGWRDLWQDCLSLSLLQPEQVESLLFNNFGGVRIDGTNATIIGTKPGEFIADRNNIPRVWMDHGSWPYLTTKLYIDQSGDIDMLLKEQTYFQDSQIKRAQEKDESWSPDDGRFLKDKYGIIYSGTILEHILVQHLTTFFNVGEHNIIRLEGADWNDTLDMARERGESTAFTAFYGSNLISITNLLKNLKQLRAVTSLELISEISLLIDSNNGTSDYSSIVYKHETLDAYYNEVTPSISGTKQSVPIDDIIKDLEAKGNWIIAHLRAQEYLSTSEGDHFYNGYYNNDGNPVDGEFDDAIRMNLTGQVFTTMFGLATDEQVLASYDACQKYLKDPQTGGYKLNTPLGPNTLNFGRGFSFAYGEKENGATFSHMVIMYMNALYKRNFVKEAYEVFSSMYHLCMDAENSKIYPGIPEYFTLTGKGMYHYLTGSASWLFLTILTEMYGIKGELGDLVIEPKLEGNQFDEDGSTIIDTRFADKQLNIQYMNPGHKDYSDYHISQVSINDRPTITSNQTLTDIIITDKSVKISRSYLSALAPNDKGEIAIIVHLD